MGKRKSLLALIGTVILLVSLAVPMMQCAPEEAVEEEEEVVPIKIGVAVPLTGYMASDGRDMKDGAIMAVEDINERGGVLGRPVEAIFFDTKELLAETFASAALKLVVEEKCDFIASGYSGESGPATFVKYDVPYLYGEGSAACIDIQTGDPEGWNVYCNNDMAYHNGRWYAETLLRIIEESGYEFPNHKLAQMGSPWEWDTDVNRGVADVLTEHGWEVVYYENFPLETREWGSALERMRELDPAIIFTEIWDCHANATFRVQFNENPMPHTLIWRGQSATMPDYIAMMGEKAEGETMFLCFGLPLGAKDWIERFENRFGREPGAMAAPNYNQVKIWANACERAGTVEDYRAVCEAMGKYRYEDPDTGNIFDFNEERYNPRNEFRGEGIYQVQNGKIVQLLFGDEWFPGRKLEPQPWVEGWGE